MDDIEFTPQYMRLKTENDSLKRKLDSRRFKTKVALIIAISACVVIALTLGGCPAYNVWSAEMKGKAELSRAEQNRQVLIAEAQANLEAERLNAEAEVARAEGAAQARQVEGLGMTAQEYVQYLWVKKLSLADTSVIYLPTDGGIVNLTQDVAGPIAIQESEE